MENINDVFGLSKEVFDKLEVKPISLKKGENIFTFKEDKHYYYLVKSGIVRSYIIDEKGKEFSRMLYTEGMALASLRRYYTNQPLILKFDALTNAELFVGDLEHVVQMSEHDIDMANTYTKMLIKSFFTLESRIYELTNTAEEKYMSLKERIPEIDNLIPQYQIASYLNVTNVQLSRIRKKLLYK